MICLAEVAASQTYLYLGGPSDLAWSCSRTFAVSRGRVVICDHATCRVNRKIAELHQCCSSFSFALLTSPVHAAIAELTNVAQTGNGLAAGEFAGGDILLVGAVNPLDQVRMQKSRADSLSRPAVVMRYYCRWAYSHTRKNDTKCRPRRSGQHRGCAGGCALCIALTLASG